MKFKRFLSFMLAVVLIVGTLPLHASAATTLGSTPYAKVEYSYSTGVTAGTIRFIQQMPNGSYFYSAYWPSSTFGGYVGSSSECGTASMSMALSYIGINKTPKEILEKNNGYTVFDDDWGATYRTPSVSAGMDNYINGNGKYSPVIIHLPGYSSAGHFVILAGKVSDNVYTVVDPAKASTWNITINGTTATYNSKTDTIDRIMQYYNPNAQIANSCTITFKANGGICSTGSISVESGSAIGSLPTPSFDDLYFEGWYTAPYGGSQVTSSTTVTGNLTLYAHYCYPGVKFNFDPNGGTLPEAIMSSTIDGVNNGRPADALVVFNNNESFEGTNIYGVEIAVDAGGRIVGTRDYGDETQLTIPAGGFILSGQLGWDSENSVHTGGGLFTGGILNLDTDSLFVSLDYETGEVKVFDSFAGYFAETKRSGEMLLLGALPVPTRDGYVFEGWYAMGSSPVTYYHGFSGTEMTAGWDSEDSLIPVASMTYDDHRYELYDYNVSWKKAKALCESLGGHLVTITDSNEQSAVTSLAEEGTRGSYQIGATDEDSEGQWTWITGETFSYSNWDPDYPEPGGETGENYAAMIAIENAPNKQVGEWNDCLDQIFGDHFYDSSNTGFICEYENACSHNYTAHYTEATCVSPGYTTYTCTLCADSYTVYDSTVSDWSTAYPSGVDESLIESKTQYRYSDYETTTSYDTSLDGWSRVGSSWQQSGSGTIQYVKSWPSGFLTSHSLYSTYNKTPKSASETETDKTTIGSDKVTGYLYYHWCRGTYTAGPINRTTKPSKEGEYNTFHAFYSTTNPSTLQSDSDGSVVYANADCCTDSHWYFHTSVNTQSYTTYRNLFTYARWTDWSDWSDTVYTESDTRSVETRTLYRYYAGGLADHVWENGYCVNCGEADPNYDTTPTGVYVQSVTGYSDGLIRLPVYVTDNDGFAGFTLTIDHDSRMTLVDISRGYLLDTSDSGSFTANVSGRTVNWVDYQNTYGDGTIFELTFDLPADAADGDQYNVSIGLKDGLASNFVDENAASKNVFFSDGYVEMDIAAEIASGWSGDLTWRLTDDGVLAFSGSGKMKNYEYKSEMPWYDYRDQINTVILEDGVTSIGAYAFYGMPSLGYISIPDSVTTIGDYAFKNCPLLDYVYLPSNLTSLGDSAFYACTSLSFIDIPASLWTVKDYTFKNCTALESVTFHEGNLMKISDGAFYNTALTAVSFPDCLSIIDGYSFKNCSKLASITLGSGINQVREAAFYGSAISEITIPEGVTSIKPYAFKNCVNLRSVDLPSTLTIVDEAAFYACTALESLDLPDAVTSIGNYAFRKCQALSSLSLGAGLVTIGECSFYGCESLVYLSVPGKVTTIKPYAFKGCTGLEYVTLPGSLETLGESAFHTCPNLSEVTIPAKVATVGAYCFSGSTGIDTFSFLGNAPSIGSGAFNKITATAYYPSGNTTWTASVRQNYGGNITWIAE